MPKIRRSRVKLHDFAPGSARRDSAASSSGRLPIFTPGNGGAGSLSNDVECKIVSFHRGNTSARVPTDNAKPGCRKHARRDVPGVPAAGAVGQPATADDATSSVKRLSRGQRRRAEKRDAWLRKFDFPKYAQKLREEHQRQQQDNYQQEGPLVTFAPALRQQLHDGDACCNTSAGICATDGAAAGGRNRVTRRSMQHLAEKEIAQYNAVVAFPAFRRSPLAVLKEHLQNTISLQRKTQTNV